MAFAAASRKSSHTRVTETLGRRIVRGSYPSGDLLPHEARLTVGLSVSRTILRESLRTLSAKGMIEARQRVGTRVTDRRRWNLLDEDVIGWHVLERRHHPDLFRQVVEARMVVEPVAAAMVAHRADARDVAAIEEALHRMTTAGADLTAYLDADVVFHRSIYDAAGNELLGQMGNVLIAALHLSHAVTSRVPDAIGRSLPLHVKLVEAIRRRSPAAARRATERLIRCVIEDLEATLGCTLEVGPL